MKDLIEQLEKSSKHCQKVYGGHTYPVDYWVLQAIVDIIKAADGMEALLVDWGSGKLSTIVHYTELRNKLRNFNGN